jgi:hypothetical protein
MWNFCREPRGSRGFLSRDSLPTGSGSRTPLLSQGVRSCTSPYFLVELANGRSHLMAAVTAFGAMMAENSFLPPRLMNNMMAAEISEQNGDPVIGNVRPLFRIRVQSSPNPVFDVSPDGKRFLINSLLLPAAPPPVTLVVNWDSESADCAAAWSGGRSHWNRT